MADNTKDPESGFGPSEIPHWRRIIDQGAVTPEIANHTYPGSGTEDDPYIITWLTHDPGNPMQFPTWYKWTITLMMAAATFSVALTSSAFSDAFPYLLADFGTSQEVVTLTLSLYVLGFAIGPLFWGPLSEMFGRQIIYAISYFAFTAFNAGICGSQNMWTVIILRFFAGSFGSSPLVNGGGVIADMFPARSRGVALASFAAAPFLGPALGPIAGGFLAETAGWRWLAGLLAAFSGLVWILGMIVAPETYAPVLLRRRASKLSKMHGKIYVSRLDAERGVVTFGEAMKTALLRPWVLLFREPIVLLLSMYIAIVYGTLYMFFGAYPIVYEGHRGWSAGLSGLAFLGIMVGMMGAVVFSIWPANPRYLKAMDEHDGFAPPEARLFPGMIGAVALPIGLFWFAWTNYNSIHWLVTLCPLRNLIFSGSRRTLLVWMASIAAGVPFGFGMLLVFLAVINYLIDAYTIFAASVLAANSVLRSAAGAGFPLFTRQMYDTCGIHWATTIPAFLTLICMPFPFLLYKYGDKIRQKSKFAAEADAFMKKVRAAAKARAAEAEAEASGEKADRVISASDAEIEKEEESERKEEEEEEEQQEEAEAYDYSYEDGSKFQRIKTGRSIMAPEIPHSYEHSPFDIDRVHSRASFSRRDSTASSFGLSRTRTGKSSGRKSSAAP